MIEDVKAAPVTVAAANLRQKPNDVIESRKKPEENAKSADEAMEGLSSLFG